MNSSYELTPYELSVQKNIEENRKVLKSLGLLDTAFELKEKKPVRPRKSTAKKEETTQDAAPTTYSAPIKRTRYSSSILKSLGFDEFDDLDKISGEGTPLIKKRTNFHEQVFGQIKDVNVGDWWSTRLECSSVGVHRPTVAGIHGKQDAGCYSIALSGGYEDDLDLGKCFTYTGCGGRDLKGTKSNPKNLRTAPQSKDQVLEGLNAALASNIESRKPVRVIRGYKLQSPYAPEEGYRYDGLYSVEKYWTAIGLSGFKVYKFALKRLPDQDPPPWETCPLLTSPEKNQLLRIPTEESASPEASISSALGASGNKKSVLNVPQKPLSMEKKKSSPKSQVLKEMSPKENGVKEIHSEIKNCASTNKAVKMFEENTAFPKNNISKRSKSYDPGELNKTPSPHKIVQNGCLQQNGFHDIDVNQVKSKSTESPNSLNQKKVRFSPKIHLQDEQGNTIETSENSKDKEGNDTEDTCEDGKKQTSILEYFYPMHKIEASPTTTKTIVNPKSLRSNRYSNFSFASSNTKHHLNNMSSNETFSKNDAPHLSEKRFPNNIDKPFHYSKQPSPAKNSIKSSSQKRKYSSVDSNSKDISFAELTMANKGLSMMENLIRQNNEKLRLHNQITPKKVKPSEYSSQVTPCSVKLMRMEESFLGWDMESSLFSGYDNGETEPSKHCTSGFETSSGSQKSSKRLPLRSNDFRGWDSNKEDFQGTSGLVPIGFMINQLES